jgi:adenylate cyclase
MVDQALTLPTTARDESRTETPKAAAQARITAAFRREVLSGLRFAVGARFAALLVIAIWVAVQNIYGPIERILYFEGLIAMFGVLGALQYFVARARGGDTKFQYLFVLADTVLLTLVLLMPVPGETDAVPIALHLRWPNFLYFFVIGASAMLSYSPLLMIWSGITTAISWTIGTWWIISLPETFALPLANTDSVGEFLVLYLDVNAISVMRWLQQIIVYMIFSCILAGIVWRAKTLVQHQAATERERANLARYFSPNMVDDLAQSDQPLGTVRRQDIAVLFADIVGFTRLSENQPPEAVISLLREFHGRMEASVFAHHGTLDKYIGDGVMATFGTPAVGPRDACNALACAREMVESIESWNRARVQRNEPPIRVSVGVHFGPVVVGDIGGEHRLEFAVIGDTVNVASRLENLTRSLDAEIVIGEDLVAAVEREAPGASSAPLAGFQQQPPQPIRGRNAALPI